ncbi:MAG TPA: hypothetical protein VHY20_03630 [Pirellulales bacterium]|nr:hypothetical protein [Pirellulales bacterium]
MGEALDQLQVFYGDASPAETRLYVRLNGASRGLGLRLSGTVIGPVCQYSQTLPATIRLVDRGATPALLAEAIVADPCFWSAESPFLYRVHAQLDGGVGPSPATDRWIGIKPLGARDRRLIYGGATHVLRGGRPGGGGPLDLPAWHTADAAIDLENPSDQILEEASRLGVWVVARLTQADVAEPLRRIARWPAVMMCVLPREAEVDTESAYDASGVILAQEFTPDEPPELASWCRAVICRSDDAERISDWSRDLPCPVIACRRDPAGGEPAQVRAACDPLQRLLAGRGEFAGYLV